MQYNQQGIMLPEKSQGKELQTTVVALGSSSKGKSGETEPVSVQIGDRFPLQEYRGTSSARIWQGLFLIWRWRHFWEVHRLK
jgi:co-chaperonin GroES (HSP10)